MRLLSRCRPTVKEEISQGKKSQYTSLSHTLFSNLSFIQVEVLECEQLIWETDEELLLHLGDVQRRTERTVTEFEDAKYGRNNGAAAGNGSASGGSGGNGGDNGEVGGGGGGNGDGLVEINDHKAHALSAAEIMEMKMAGAFRDPADSVDAYGQEDEVTNKDDDSGWR